MFLFQTEAAAIAQVNRLKKQGHTNAYYSAYSGFANAQSSGRPAKWAAYYGS